MGLLLGGAVCGLQDYYGLVGMGMENALVASYPIKLKSIDFLTTSSVIFVITVLISFYPASLAAKTYSTKDL
jgi:lipoprotein-releasing system permease protein